MTDAEIKTKIHNITEEAGQKLILANASYSSLIKLLAAFAYLEALLQVAYTDFEDPAFRSGVHETVRDTIEGLRKTAQDAYLKEEGKRENPNVS